MNTLAEQQRAMQRAITTRQDAGTLLRGLRGEPPMLRIYQHAYEARLIAALRDNFGVLPQVMGDEAFDALASAYVAAHPSQVPSIRWFGDQLPAFMTAHEDLVPHPALVDLARMEWGLRGAFDAGDATPIDASALAGIAPEQWASLVFTALPSVRLLRMQWAVEPVWRALQSVGEGEEPELPEPAEHGHALLIWRQGLENRWRSLDNAQADLLQAALDGAHFGQLCELAAQQSDADQAAGIAVAALQSWLADGLLMGARVAS
jgi:hypothetical protein